MADSIRHTYLAPGAPGNTPTWAPGKKDGIGTAISSTSNVWFTIGQGILNEVYYPQVDTPSIRELELIVTDGASYVSRESASVDSKLTWSERAIPAFTVTNTSRDHKYRLEKRIVSDPERPVVLQHIAFQSSDSLRVYAYLNPHLGNMGAHNNASVRDYDGTKVLVAARKNFALALASSSPFKAASAGFVGTSDGLNDIAQHGRLTVAYEQARDGNTALTAELDLAAGSVTLALGFGTTIEEAAANATRSLQTPFDEIWRSYNDDWQTWLDHCGAKLPADVTDLALRSLTTIKTHESKNPSGGLVAGLATPWGQAKGDDDKIGYHVIWTRDMVEYVGSLLAVGAHEGIHRILRLLKHVQQPDGHWPQNMWIDGTPFWNGIQMDETALPILLVNIARREGAISELHAIGCWHMVRQAASYLLQNGPVTGEDRWEEDPGYTPFTIAAEIAALLAAADLAELAGEKPAVAAYLRETADIWYSHIDAWLYAKDTDWCKQFGIKGYYERIVPVTDGHISRLDRIVQVKNVPSDQALLKDIHLISPDALALVRFGLRRADDPRITDTVRAIDELLKIDTPNGTTWHRYNNDGYGEHEDGTPFDGVGVGRGWPLLTGERAHYELAAGHTDQAEKLKTDMERFTDDGGLLPEQVWDRDAIPERGLHLGHPTGSATPLAWAHGEYLKLIRSLADGQIFDRPPQTVKRYLERGVTSNTKPWRFNHKIRTISHGKTLRIETLAAAQVHWTADNWQTVHDDPTQDTSLGVHFLDLDTASLSAGTKITFTFFWPQANVWEQRNFEVNCS